MESAAAAFANINSIPDRTNYYQKQVRIQSTIDNSEPHIHQLVVHVS